MDLGISIKQFGYWQIWNIILVFIGTIVFIGSVASIGSTATDLNDALNQLISSIQVFFFFILFLEIISIYVILRIYQKINAYEPTDEFYLDSLHKAKITLLIAIALSIIRIIMFYLFLQSFLDDLRNLADGNITIEELEAETQKISNQAWYISIFLLVTNSLLALVFYFLKAWVQHLSMEAENAFKNTLIGYVLALFGDLLGLNPDSGLSRLLGLVGLIFIIYGTIKGGKSLENLKWGFNDQPIYIVDRPKQTIEYPTSTGYIFCRVCGTQNAKSTNFCIQCGTPTESV